MPPWSSAGSTFCQFPLDQCTPWPALHHSLDPSHQPFQGQVLRGEVLASILHKDVPGAPARTESFPRSWVGRKPSVGGKEQGDRSGCAHLTCLPQGTFPKSLGQATQHCTGELSPNSTLLGNLGESLSISVLPLGHSPPTVADIQPMPATASPGKDAFFLNPRSTSQKQGFFPFLIFMVGSSQSWHVLIRIRNAEKEVQQRSYDFLWAAEPRGGNN